MTNTETTKPVRVDVWSDYVCPWCFMASLNLKRVSETQPLDVHWHAYELRPAGSPPISPEHLARIEASEPMLDARMKSDFGIVLERGPFGIPTRHLHMLTKYAEAQGKGSAFHDAAFEAYWLEGRDVSAPAELQALLDAVGVEGEVAEIVQDPKLQSKVYADERFAYENELSGVPALVFEQKYLVMGAQPVPALRQVIAQVQSEQSAEPTEG